MDRLESHPWWTVEETGSARQFKVRDFSSNMYLLSHGRLSDVGRERSGSSRFD